MEKIINEINSVKRFMSARSTHSSCDLSQLVDSFAAQLLKLIGKTHLGPGEVAAVMEELSTNNPYGSTHTDSIIKSLDKHMVDSQDHEHDGTENAVSGKQMLHHWWTYPTASDWTVLLDPQKGFYVKMSIMVHRGRKCGITNPEEQALKWLLAFLMKCHYQEIPPVVQRWNQLNELKALFASEQENRPDMVCPLPLRTYPKNAKDLPDHILRAAYAADDMPIDKSDDMTGLTAIALQIPLRKTSRLLKGTGFADDAIQPTKKARLSSSHGACAYSKNELTSGHAKIEPIANTMPTLAPKLESHHPDGAKFCNQCGHSLRDQVEAACIKTEPDSKDRIRQQLRLNGQPVASQAPALSIAPKTEDMHEKQEHSLRSENNEPPLDPYAQAAIDALKTRNERRLEANLAAKAEAAKAAKGAVGKSKTEKDLEPGDADHDDSGDDDEDDDDADDAVKKKPSTKRPAASTATLKHNAKPVFNPSFHIEMSRSAVQCRHGVKASEAGGVIAPSFRFNKFPKGKTGAVQAAKKWVAEFKKTHKCS